MCRRLAELARRELDHGKHHQQNCGIDEWRPRRDHGARTGIRGAGSKGEHAWITEGIGVAPDMEVDNLPYATYQCEDAQLDAAIAYLMDRMAKEPLAAPVMPAFQNKVKL